MQRLFAVLALIVVTSPAAAQDSWPSKQPRSVPSPPAAIPMASPGFIQRGYPRVSASSW